jgi:hypothetical protein
MLDNPIGPVIGCSLKKRKKDQEETNERTKKLLIPFEICVQLTHLVVTNNIQIYQKYNHFHIKHIISFEDIHE